MSNRTFPLIAAVLLFAGACTEVQPGATSTSPSSTTTPGPQVTATVGLQVTPTPTTAAVVAPTVTVAAAAIPTATAARATATPVAAAPTPTPTPTAPGNQPMLWYGSSGSAFAIQYPGNWSGGPVETNLTIVTLNQNTEMSITEASLTGVGMGRLTPDEVIDQILASIQSNVSNFKVLSRDKVTPQTGGTTYTIEYTAVFGQLPVHSKVLGHISDQKILFMAEYDVVESEFAKFVPLIDYTFKTFRTGDAADRPRQFASAYRSAADSLQNGDAANAASRFTEALEVEPSMLAVLLQRATAHWQNKDNANALKDLDVYLKSYETDGEGHNLSALVHAAAGNHPEALKEANRALEIIGNDSYHILDTRGFIYLKMGEWQKALDDYQTAIDGGFDISYVLLGKGIALANLGKVDDAKKNLFDGLDLVDQDADKSPDPELTDLLAMTNATLQKLGATRPPTATPAPRTATPTPQSTPQTA